MDDLRKTEVGNHLQERVRTQLRIDLDSNDEQKPRHKPGPVPKENPRTDKISCRLTKTEKANGLRYCRAHGTTEAKLLRASYLAAITQTPHERISKIVDVLARLPNMSKMEIRDVLRKSALFLLLILFGMFLSAAPTVAKYMLHNYLNSSSIVYHSNNACVYHTGEMGCEMIQVK